MRATITIAIGLCIALTFAASPKAIGEERTASHGAQKIAAPHGPWQFSMTPYVWAYWFNADQTVRAQTVSIDTHLITIVRKADSVAGWFSFQEARNGKLSVYSDVQWADVKLSGGKVRTKRVSPGLSITASTNIGLRLELGVVEAGVMYEIARHTHSGTGPLGVNNTSTFTPHTTFELLAGARYWHLKNDLNFSIALGATIPPGLTRRGFFSARASAGDDWVDPLIGMRIRHHLRRGEQLVLRSDVGGFGVGSDFSWQVFGGYIWDCGCKVLGGDLYGAIGYRALAVDYADGRGRNRFAYDAVQHGPVIGARLQF